MDESVPEEAPGGTKTSGEISLNIEETNKLRANLGLKPLQVDEQGDNKTSSQVTEEVHAPPSNLGALQAAEKLREKMETIREKREQHKKLSAVKTLGEPDNDDYSAVSWLKKFDLAQEEKEKAQRRAKMLAEMDEEFGVGDLVEGAMQEKTYTSRDLKGLIVEHKEEEFVEGKDVVLTLKDSGVLEENDDVLVNINILESEHARRNIHLRRKRTDYDPYEEMDEEAMQQTSILKKYNEEIEGVKKANFELGEFGDVDTSKEREAQIVKMRLQSQALTLEKAPAKIASEYFTKDEMVQFRKPKRKKKVRKLKADDLLGISPDSDMLDERDHGTRGKKSADGEDSISKLEEEDTDPLIGTAFQRAKRLVKEGVSRTSGAAKVAQICERESGRMSSSDLTGDEIVLDKTAEFCRQLGEEEDHVVKEERGDIDRMDVQEGDYQEAMGSWTEVDVNAPREFQPKEEELYQEAEPNVSSGLSAALQMAGRKGFIDTSKQKKDSSSVVHVYSDVHRDKDYERQKERERERDLSHSRIMLFPEKKSYNPHVNIEYVDDKGRDLTPKEAFRYMSHKFHGRGSGKRKTEKRMKKLREEHFMNKSSSVDTPLNTLAMLQSKQKKSQTPYILISGGSQSMLAPDLEKK
ncbi:U4/U6.U5 tri-snRNP-associated protein 1 [Geodia barretti]|nr:U4/U6.U5 tri-snRNP-associated protein 1 [Geodia barretti]